MDCSPSGFSIRGVFQARILEWAATPFSRGSSLPRGWAWISHLAGRFFTWPLPRTLDEDLNGFTGVSYELVQKRALDSTFPHPDWLLFQAPCLRKGQHNPLGYLRQKSRDVPVSLSFIFPRTFDAAFTTHPNPFSSPHLYFYNSTTIKSGPPWISVLPLWCPPWSQTCSRFTNPPVTF